MKHDFPSQKNKKKFYSGLSPQRNIKKKLNRTNIVGMLLIIKN